MNGSNVIAIMTCPACEGELDVEQTPHIDWKRGTVRLNLKLTQDACEHLASCLGFISTDLDALTTEGQPAEPETEEGAQTPPADELKSEDAPPVVGKPAEKPKETPKSRASKAKTSE